MIRLDKLLADLGLGSRKDVARLVKRGRVEVDGVVVREPDAKVPETSAVAVDGFVHRWRHHHHRVVHKPVGTVTSTVDKDGPSVLGVLPDEDRGRAWMPVGRLDADTTGLLVLTTDGELAHRLTHPKHKVDKVYEAVLERPATAEDARLFAGGFRMGGEQLLPADLSWTGDGTVVRLVLREGRYHQVKRMFGARGNTVTALRRVAFGPLVLGDLAEGASRPLTDAEERALYASVGLQSLDLQVDADRQGQPDGA